MEMVWQGSSNLGMCLPVLQHLNISMLNISVSFCFIRVVLNMLIVGSQGALFTGVNFNGYGAPPGFCYDKGCKDPPIMVDTELVFNTDKSILSL